MMSIGRGLVLAFATLVGLLSRLAHGHGGLTNYTVGDTWYRGYNPDEPAIEQDGMPWLVQRKWTTIDPVFDVDSPYIACNTPGTPPPSYIPIRAGEELSAIYYYWLHPVGPMTVWLAACGDDCASVDVNKVGWFKIWEAGLLSGDVCEGMWYQKQFQKWDGSPDVWPVTIPAALKSGLYIVRHEILSIHIENKPQFYPECAHLNITGGGTQSPPESFLKYFPGEYTMDDPSININIYTDENRNSYNYTIPGGPVWDGFGVVNKYCIDC